MSACLQHTWNYLRLYWWNLSLFQLGSLRLFFLFLFFLLQSINSRGGFGLHQINPLVRFSSMKCKNLRLRSFVVRSRSGSDPKSKIINKSVDFPKDYNELVNQVKLLLLPFCKFDYYFTKRIYPRILICKCTKFLFCSSNSNPLTST